MVKYPRQTGNTPPRVRSWLLGAYLVPNPGIAKCAISSDGVNSLSAWSFGGGPLETRLQTR